MNYINKMDKSLGLLGLLAAGVGLYFIAEKTPEGKKAISNIHQAISNVQTGITEVSTTPTQPDLSKGRCPKGMYLDQTDGIYRCHSAGHTRELNPNVKLFNPQWQNAWGFDNMTQPLVQPDINKQIESQIKKGHQKEKEVKHQKNLDDKRLIREKGNVPATQVECPKDLSQLTCGSHCYKNGHLMAVDCSGQKNKAKETKKKTPSLVVPPNFPSQVTVTAPGEEPYPETDTENQDVGGIQLPSDQQPIYPTIPSTSPTPIAPAPQLGRVFYPFKPWAGKYFFKHGDTIDPNGCVGLELRSGGTVKSCRWLADRQQMLRNIGNNGYRIDADITLGQQDSSKNQELSITSGGPGSSGKNCCGFTCRINIKNGTLQMESEDWSEGSTTGATYCRGVDCVAKGPTSISSGQPLYGSTIHIAWVVTRQGNNATYHMEATGPGGTIISKSFTNPHAHKSGGPPIIPFHIISGKLDTDADRIRVDSCKTVNFHTPKVTVLPSTAYFGELGYIEDKDQDFLI